MRILRFISATFITLLLITVCPTMAFADAVGSWHIYPSFNQIELVETAGDVIFVKASGNLYTYNTSDGSISTYDKSNGLSDVGITMMSWNATAKRMVVAYENSNIDIISTKGDVFNIPDLYLKQMTGNKAVNYICQEGKYAYMATGFGIMKVDVEKGYIADSYVLNKAMSSVAILNGYIYAQCADTEGGVLRAQMTDNLNNPASWKQHSHVYFQYLFTLGNKLIGMTDGNANTIDTTTGEVVQIGLFNFSWAKKCGDRIVCGKTSKVTELLSNLTFNTYSCPNSITNAGYSTTQNKFWANDGSNRLTRFGVKGTSLTAETTGVMPEGPVTNDSYALDFAGGKLYAVNGYYTVDKTSGKEGKVYWWDGNSWDYNTDNIASTTKRRYRDLSCIKVAPYDHNIVMAAGETGLYRFVNGKYDRVYDSGNSPLVSAVPTSSEPRNWSMVLSMVYDKEGNLWTANSKNPSILCLKKDGEWETFDHSSLLSGEFYTAPMGALIDRRGYFWFCSTQWEKSRVFCYDIKNDKLKRYNNFVNQDNTRYEPALRNLAEDKNGNIWIAGTKGPFYIKSEDIESGEEVMTQHKVPRNDGTNFADYLLSDVDIICIAVDAANRKWMGTNGQGVFVISDDCNTQEYNFTSDNSPLPSNTITDIKIDDKTGMVYFATDRGICSYMSGVSESNDNVDDGSVWAYPNPVTPDYTGFITVCGLANGSEVTITTVSGQKVAEGRSVGGSFIWDGLDNNGNRVASGVYMVLVAGPEGNNNIATKIAVVR